MKILMVCLGNICRSPLAQGILEKKIKENGLNWIVDSAGTGGWHIGEQPDSRSIAVAKKYNIDITNQSARKFRGQDLEAFDLIFAMDQSNYNDITKHAQSSEEIEKVHLILNLLYPDKNKSVPDPYWNDNGFEEVYHMLNKACEQLTKHFS